ncbi:MAG: ligand-gated channel protein [Draconibacterium sp.]|nr:MAG: ligand-gated channel protein [Draconibacterium sp.]
MDSNTIISNIKKIGRILFVVMAVLILLSGEGIAQYDLVVDSFQLEEVLVTGTPVKVNRNNVPLTVSVINRKKIEQSDESALLPILNGNVPGLFVTERGITGFGVAKGAAGQISIRGVGGNPTTGVLMLIDGHPQFMGIMGHPLPDAYVASDVERVEVIRGPASVLYGTNATGGVINIITRKQLLDGVHGNARISYGSFNTQKYMGAVGYRKDKFSVYLSLNHDQTDGHRQHSDFKITNGYTKLEYRFNTHFHATVDFSLAAYKAADPGPDTTGASYGKSIDIQRGYSSFILLNEFKKASGTVKLFYNFGEHKITDGFHSIDKNMGANIYESIHLFYGNTITFGVDYNRYGGMAENLKAMGGAGIVFADTAVTEIGTYAFVQQTIKEKIILNGGLRYNHHSVYGEQWVPSAGFTWKTGLATTWKGNVAKGFCSPTLRELFLWGPNPNLNPETVISYETGISHLMFKGRLKGEITVYALKSDNLIVTVPLKGLQNSGKVANKGVEIAIEALPTNHLTINTTYSYIDMKTPVFATPKHHLFLGTDYQSGKWLFTANIQNIISLDNDPRPFVNQVNYTVLNAKAGYQLSPNIKLYVSGENLTGTRYQVNRYYTMPGMTLFGGITYRF